MWKSRSKAPPVIGITADWHTTWVAREPDEIFHYRLKATYAEAVRAAGCIPMIIPYLGSGSGAAALARKIDGLVVSGSPIDIDPYLLGAAKKPRGEGGALRRHTFEIALTGVCVERGVPVLGICGGEQIICAAFGGTLIDDIPSEVRGAVRHRRRYHEVAHDVEVVEGSLLHRAAGSSGFAVNSTHHQAVDRPGRGLVVSALAPDGVVEAIEARGGAFVLGVQWHPEALMRRLPHRRIFQALADAARGGPAG
jgi:putative glutamine amidotransferase